MQGDPAEFTRQVRSALANLYDPVALRKHPLARNLAVDGAALRQRLLDAIESLKPGPAVSPSSHASEIHSILQLRYVEARDAAEIQHELALSKSQYYREHEQAVKQVASLLAREPQGLDEQLEHSERLPGRESKGRSLPLRPTSFVGRQRELAEIRQRLRGTQLLTLI